MIALNLQLFGGRGGTTKLGSRLSPKSLESYGPDNYATPFSMIAQDVGNEIARFNFRMGKYSNIGPVKNMNLPIETVSLSVLKQNQPMVSKSKVDALLKMTTAQIEAIKDKSTASDIPFVIKYKGVYQIQDGHHRLAALYAKGKKTTKVRVLDLDKF